MKFIKSNIFDEPFILTWKENAIEIGCLLLGLALVKLFGVIGVLVILSVGYIGIKIYEKFKK